MLDFSISLICEILLLVGIALGITGLEYQSLRCVMKLLPNNPQNMLRTSKNCSVVTKASHRSSGLIYQSKMKLITSYWNRSVEQYLYRTIDDTFREPFPFICPLCYFSGKEKWHAQQQKGFICVQPVRLFVCK